MIRYFLVLFLIGAGCRGAEDPAPVQSAVLKQELIDLHKESLAGTSDPSPAALAKIEQEVEASIAEIREQAPDFLLVTRATEEKLQAGEPIPGSARRIEQAEAFLEEFQIEYPGAISRLLKQYKAGDLGPVRAELLAELMDALRAKVADALTAGS